MTTTTPITTAEQLLKAGDIGRCELVRGELIMMTPAGSEHGSVASELAFQMTAHVKAHRLGRVYIGETGFVLSRDPDTVRVPDISFLGTRRMPAPGHTGYIGGAPDLAVEVLSPDNTAPKMRIKVGEYLSAGTLAVWVVDPRKEIVTVHAAGGARLVLSGKDRLTGGTILPGFELVIQDLFEASR